MLEDLLDDPRMLQSLTPGWEETGRALAKRILRCENDRAVLRAVRHWLAREHGGYDAYRHARETARRQCPRRFRPIDGPPP